VLYAQPTTEQAATSGISIIRFMFYLPVDPLERMLDFI
jgi:hypothetical protein